MSYPRHKNRQQNCWPAAHHPRGDGCAGSRHPVHHRIDDDIRHRILAPRRVTGPHRRHIRLLSVHLEHQTATLDPILQPANHRVHVGGVDLTFGSPDQAANAVDVIWNDQNDGHQIKFWVVQPLGSAFQEIYQLWVHFQVFSYGLGDLRRIR